MFACCACNPLSCIGFRTEEVTYMYRIFFARSTDYKANESPQRTGRLLHVPRVFFQFLTPCTQQPAWIVAFAWALARAVAFPQRQASVLQLLVLVWGFKWLKQWTHW